MSVKEKLAKLQKDASLARTGAPVTLGEATLTVCAPPWIDSQKWAEGTNDELVYNVMRFCVRIDDPGDPADGELAFTDWTDEQLGAHGSDFFAKVTKTINRFAEAASGN